MGKIYKIIILEMFHVKNKLNPASQGGRKKKKNKNKQDTPRKQKGGDEWPYTREDMTQEDEDRFDQRMRDIGVDIDWYLNRHTKIEEKQSSL